MLYMYCGIISPTVDAREQLWDGIAAQGDASQWAIVVTSMDNVGNF